MITNTKNDTSDTMFDSILPANKLWYSPKEAAYALGKSTQYIRDCLDNQRILGHVMHGRAQKGKEKRNTYQISRQSLIIFLKETANYEPDQYRARTRMLSGL